MPNTDPVRRRQVFQEWYNKNKERLAEKKRVLRLNNIERYKTYQNRAKEKRRQAISQYKLERGCAICGYRGHPEALEFDHLPGTDKKKHISLMYRDRWSDVVKEIEKCQVLCANCHAIATAERRRSAKQAKKQATSTEQQLRLFGA